MTKTKKIFITGGTGFVGQHLVPALVQRGYKLLVLVRSLPRGKRSNPKIVFLKGDLAASNWWTKKVKSFRPDVVIHLAWEGLELYDFSANTSLKNLTNALNLLNLAVECKCKKFLSLGSCWEYGDDRGKLEESGKLKPPNHVPAFVIAKRTIQAFGEQIALENKMQFLWPRLFFVYGPGQKARALVPSLVGSFESGMVPEIKNKVGGNDFIYIEDAVEAIVKILEKCKKPCAVYNIGSGHLTSVARIANITAKSFNRAPFMKEPKRPKGFCADISRIHREIGWRPKTSIEEGIKRTIIGLTRLAKFEAKGEDFARRSKATSSKTGAF
ncbi:MAG: NAD(P)-dependent oxidoreductase [bacterium]|nr:NAD(P)-dependent oxidoreductase [bacterium]